MYCQHIARAREEEWVNVSRERYCSLLSETIGSLFQNDDRGVSLSPAFRCASGCGVIFIILAWDDFSADEKRRVPCPTP